jgi:hypothetical protein
MTIWRSRMSDVLIASDPLPWRAAMRRLETHHG